MKQNERDLKFTDWAMVSEQHGMKPHAAKMRFLRIRKQLEDDESELLGHASRSSRKSTTGKVHLKLKSNKRKIIDQDCTDDEETPLGMYKCRKMSSDNPSCPSFNNILPPSAILSPFPPPLASTIDHLMDRILLLEEKLLDTRSDTKTAVKKEWSEANTDKKFNSTFSKSKRPKNEDDGIPSSAQVKVQSGEQKGNEVMDDGIEGLPLWYHDLSGNMAITDLEIQKGIKLGFKPHT